MRIFRPEMLTEPKRVKRVLTIDGSPIRIKVRIFEPVQWRCRGKGKGWVREVGVEAGFDFEVVTSVGGSFGFDLVVLVLSGAGCCKVGSSFVVVRNLGSWCWP
ncbi:hypothetical protein Droror1_Dr00009959 [Drosera rotundifolia]